MLRIIFWCVRFYSLCALALSNLQFLHPYRVLFTGVANIRHYKSSYSGGPDNIQDCNTDCCPRYQHKPLRLSLQNPFTGCLWIASSSTMSKLLHHLSHYWIALNLIFPAFTLSVIFSNFSSSLQQMEHTPSQVRTHYGQKDQEAHLERALALKKAATLRSPANDCLPIIRLRASYCGWPISPISLLYQDDKTNQEISDDDSENTGESSSSSHTEEDDLDHQQVVLHLGQVHREKSSCTPGVPLRKKRSCADTVIGCPPLPNSRNLPAAMAPPLLERQ